mmetsp:Transcript_8592/g.11029  ORF Transcript_8592/g.11029 Transcript_8592/m.11029 type:complete len:161 (-) Transcript_8592:301-783(-)
MGFVRLSLLDPLSQFSFSLINKNLQYSYEVKTDTTLNDLRRMIDCVHCKGLSRRSVFHSEIMFASSRAPNLFERDESHRSIYKFAIQKENGENQKIDEDVHINTYNSNSNPTRPNICLIEVEDDPLFEIFGNKLLVGVDIIVVPLMFVNPSTGEVIFEEK